MSRKINRKPIVSPVKIVRPPDSNKNSELITLEMHFYSLAFKLKRKIQDIKNCATKKAFLKKIDKIEDTISCALENYDSASRPGYNPKECLENYKRQLNSALSQLDNLDSELKGGSSSAIITDFKNSITELLKKIPKFSPDNNAPQNPPPSSHDNLR